MRFKILIVFFSTWLFSGNVLHVSASPLSNVAFSDNVLVITNLAHLKAKKLSDKNQVPLIKRKYKPKGVEVNVVHIAELDFERYFGYTENLKQTSDRAIYLLLPHFYRQRGPPSA